MPTRHTIRLQLYTAWSARFPIGFSNDGTPDVLAIPMQQPVQPHWLHRSMVVTNITYDVGDQLQMPASLRIG